MPKVQKIAIFRPKGGSGETELDREIRRWRVAGVPGDAEEEALGEGRRARILAEVRRMRRSGAHGRRAPLLSLFVPTRRLALAGALPALLLSLGLGLLVAPHRAPGPARGALRADAAVRLEATKQDGDVVFLIANGGDEHRVYRTNNPRALPNKAYATAQGAFRDRLDAGGAVVFYRID